EADVRRLLDGIELEDGIARAVAVKRRGAARSGNDRVRITMREGRKREVRRIFLALGHPVRRLIRLRYGPIRPTGIAPGTWRRRPGEGAAAHPGRGAASRGVGARAPARTGPGAAVAAQSTLQFRADVR